MEKPVTHKFLNSAVFTALLLPLAFFTLRDTIALLTQPLFLSIGGEDSFLYLINDDISRLIMAGLIVLVMPLYFRGKCDFGFRGGLVKLGLLLALPELIVPLWNLLQIKVYDAPLVTGTAAVCAAVVHGIGPGVSEEVLCRSFTVSNLMRIWKDKPNRILRCALVSGGAFGLLHATNVIVTGDPLAALVQVIYTAGLGVLNGAIYLRTRSIWGVMLLHTLTDITAFIAVFDDSASGMDILFCVFGTLLFVALALYLIRPAKRQEIDALWADGWSFGDENGRRHAGAKVAAIVSAVLVAAFAASLGVIVFQAKMGYDIPMFSVLRKAPDKDVHYQISDDGRELTISLPYTGSETYGLENSDTGSLALKDSRPSGDTYVFVFSHPGSDTEDIRLTFSRRYGDMPISMKDYTVTVRFGSDGRISSIGG